MDRIKNGWFSEVHNMWPGQALSLEVEEVLYHGSSEYQDILVFRSKSYGNVLVLDGAIQITERDEFAYQELITHLPVMVHRMNENKEKEESSSSNSKSKSSSRKALVIGGGDGGVLRELSRHSCFDEIHLCEIDKMVPEMSKKYFPQVCVGFEDPRVQLHFMDGFQFLDEHRGEFDIIITDASDPEGPAEALFEEKFYSKCKDALKDDGVLCTQAESIWLHLDLIRDMSQFVKRLFPSFGYAFGSTPTYPSGTIGFFVCSKEEGVDVQTPQRKLDDCIAEQLKYYSPQVHASVFVLPAFAKRALE
eukprot:gb/GECH01014247.1/.p1 GENE.gb/GECH01014247.1/~~gb/GECH01014247.1/.p1  ORF type:complete len:305 (+),score=68.93 gb/GECH01014247.1/:1-915(+)